MRREMESKSCRLPMQGSDVVPAGPPPGRCSYDLATQGLMEAGPPSTALALDPLGFFSFRHSKESLWFRRPSRAEGMSCGRNCLTSLPNWVRAVHLQGSRAASQMMHHFIQADLKVRLKHRETISGDQLSDDSISRLLASGI
ncbi:hypothetical protein CLAIMM_09349 isoform 2 [Cladophialophora immunda]|nr:hypothetical protein CLAIMM_09349 isoform 1 [Cladophialophora immunda]OQV04474.1 hypothetical protein CLAIMM_09349 isoform 2 [Cladophialophora immunda]